MSRPFLTPCFPAGAGPDFINAAVSVEWSGTPAELLALLHATEAAFGRDRSARWSARTLDIDLIAFGALVLPDRQTWRDWAELDLDEQMRRAPDKIVLPHPRLQDRAFVLLPLADIAPDWRHPILGRTVAQMLSALDPAEIDAISPQSWGDLVDSDLVNRHDRP